MERLGQLAIISNNKPNMEHLASERYTRHTILKEVGEKGQEIICNAKVLVVGAGGLGSPALLYLCAAGVGTIGILDDDIVSESNLQRQILYDSNSVGQPKVEVASRKLQALNPMCDIFAMQKRLTASNADDIIANYDVVVDATDNLLSRYTINDACIHTGKPFVYGSICEFEGQVSVFNYKEGPNYRDLYPYHKDVADFRQPLGVIGALPGVIGSIQASETIKIILDRQDTLSGKLLLIDLLKDTFHTFKINKNKDEIRKSGDE